MRQLRRNPSMHRRAAGAFHGNLTGAEAVAIRSDEARLAAHCANRAEQARDAGRYGAMRYWTQEYRRAATQCRLLGERIRGESAGPPATGAGGDITVARLTPRPAADVPSGGEAA
jgi:hypothetical protein